MISFSAELEDVCFKAVRSNQGLWPVNLFPSEQAKLDFPEHKDSTATLVLDDEEMSALLYLAAGNDDTSDMVSDMYNILEPKLEGLPNHLRPIP